MIVNANPNTSVIINFFIKDMPILISMKSRRENNVTERTSTLKMINGQEDAMVANLISGKDDITEREVDVVVDIKKKFNFIELSFNSMNISNYLNRIFSTSSRL
jgi:hypothetical protein